MKHSVLIMTYAPMLLPEQSEKILGCTEKIETTKKDMHKEIVEKSEAIDKQIQDMRCDLEHAHS